MRCRVTSSRGSQLFIAHRNLRGQKESSRFHSTNYLKIQRRHADASSKTSAEPRADHRAGPDGSPPPAPTPPGRITTSCCWQDWGSASSRARGMSRSHRCRGRSLRSHPLRSHGVGRHPRQPRRRHAQPGRIEGSVVAPGERSRAAPALAAQAPIERRPFAARTLGLVVTEHAGQLRCRRGRSYRDWPRRGAAARLAEKFQRRLSRAPALRQGAGSAIHGLRTSAGQAARGARVAAAKGGDVPPAKLLANVFSGRLRNDALADQCPHWRKRTCHPGEGAGF